MKNLGTGKIVFIILVVIIIAGVVWSLSSGDSEQTEQLADGNAADGDTRENSGMADVGEGGEKYKGKLADVTGGSDVRGVNTGGEASGEVHTIFDGEVFTLEAIFQGLPDPAGTDFYEGWIVLRDPLEAISTGRLEKQDNVYVNNFTSSRDLTGHDFYVLTIEPDDGDPAPADHVVEGEVLPVNIEVSPRAEAGANNLVFSGEVLAGDSSPLIDFNEADYNKVLASDKLVMLYFYANWCPTCKFEEATALKPAFNDIEHDGAVGFRVNFNDNKTDDLEKQLARDHGVVYQEAKVFIKNGEVVHQAPNPWSKDEYIDTINSLI